MKSAIQGWPLRSAEVMVFPSWLVREKSPAVNSGRGAGGAGCVVRVWSMWSRMRGPTPEAMRATMAMTMSPQRPTERIFWDWVMRLLQVAGYGFAADLGGEHKHCEGESEGDE